MTALETLGVWAGCAAQAAPLRVMRIVDATSRLVRAPEVRFAASEIGLEAFGHNIENRHLLAALDARAQTLPSLRGSRTKPARSRRTTPARPSLSKPARALPRASSSAPMGGARSAASRPASKATAASYPQTALTFNLAHARPHQDISTEFHTESGPFTLVPLPASGRAWSGWWSPPRPSAIAALDDAALNDEIEQRSHSILGKIAVEPGRGVFPLSVETARRFGQGRVALIGEAAHLIPPIGAQGLNLGLRDAATIGELVVSARRDGGDVGAADCWRAMTRCAAPTCKAAPSRSTFSTARCCPISCRCKARGASPST